jgi:hypothetical protein
VPHRHHKPGARIFVRSTSFVRSQGATARTAVGLLYDGCDASLLENIAKKLLRRKKNESWAMRRFEKHSRPNKSDSRSWR